MRAFLVVELPPMSTDLANLEFTADEMRRMGYATIERLVDHILSLETQPARGDVAAADLCRCLREPAPEQGVAYEPLLDQLLAEWVPRSFTAPGPGGPWRPRAACGPAARRRCRAVWRVPVCGHVGPPRRRVCHDRWPARHYGPGRDPLRTNGRCPAPAAPPARDCEPVPGHRGRARLLWKPGNGKEKKDLVAD